MTKNNACYNISRLNLFSIQGLNRGELSNIHSLLLFMYNRKYLDPIICFKYSEITWLSSETIAKTINLLSKLNLIEIIKKPTKQEPFFIKLKTNDEIQQNINKDIALNFEKIKNTPLTKELLKELLNCQNLYELFDVKQIKSWLRNVNSGTWDKYKFIMLATIISYIPCDYRIKSATLNKYTAKPALLNSIEFLYSKLPDDRKNLLFKRIDLTLNSKNLKNNGSFVDMCRVYLHHLLTT